MIPILYAANENTFTTYGIGALSDAVSCVVTEERNGSYELILQYPITGKLYGEIQAERIIKAQAHPIGNHQLFRIYRMSKPIRGIVTVYAQHISYDLSGIPVAPFSQSYTATAAMAYLFTGTAFTGSSDKSGSQTVACTTPKSIRAMLGGTEGSLLDLWGGEFRWDNFTVYLNTARGSDKDVIIEYGKNLTDLLADHDLTDVYSELLPYATYMDASGVSHTVTGTAQSITSVITRKKSLIKDFTYILGLDPEVVPTVNQINTAAQNYLSANPLGYETPSLTVSFVDGEHGANYPESAARIDLCDTVTIRYTALGVNVKAKVVKTEFDSLLERYTKLTIGKPRANMATTVANLTDEVSVVKEYPTRWSDAIAVATQLITGNTGGYVILHEGVDGKPYELLIMDNPDINSAQNVWRWNVNGLGFSSSGYSGPYATAITANGSIVADFITTGELNADLIKAGALIIKDALNNILLKADIDTKTVLIAGFTVRGDRFYNTKTAAMSSYPTKTETYTTELANRFLRAYYKGWKPSPNTQQLFEYEQSVRIDRESITVLNNEANNPDYPGNFESTDIKPDRVIVNGGPNGIQIIAKSTESYIKIDGSNGATTINQDEFRIVDNNGVSKVITPTGPSITSAYDSKSLTNNTWTRLTAFQLLAGKYLFTATAKFDTNATGRRTMVLSATDAGTTAVSREFTASAVAVNGGQTILQICAPIDNSTTRLLYLNAFQNSGGSLNTDWIYDFVRLI